MPHDTSPGLDTVPDGVSTLVDTAFVALAAVLGVGGATVVATLAAPLGPTVGLVTLFVAWPVGFLVAALALRGGVRAVARTGLPADARTAVRRGRARSRPPVVTDGGETCDRDVACDCH